ncbi:MAG: heat-shock protein [Nanohaloarchaea archaeon SW_7_43_1]|nr:MAG: heat-shock protein [Nanohaloarchaea archaeon SW_7_43_1]
MRRLDRRDGIDDVVGHMQKMFNQFQDITDIGGKMPINMKEEDGKVIISADIPGVQKENINLKADRNGLEISAESKEEIKEENEKYIRKERTSRRYRRKVAWPKEVDPKSVSADYSDGVLKVEAEKESENENWDVEID